MSSYIVRVELHRETDYQKLHDAMLARGLKRLITAGDGMVYKLSTGVYAVENASASRETVYNAASAAASSIGHHNPAILVVDSNGCTWSGLEQASSYEQQRMGA